MALQITGSIELSNGIQLNELYARIDANLAPSGITVYGYPQFWISEQAFTNGQNHVNIDVPGKFAYDYNRTTDGVDILEFASQKAKEEFEELGYSVTIVGI